MFPAISPRNPQDILVACDMTGSYVSHDGGSSWRMFNLGGVVKSFTFDPNDARTYYARTSGESIGKGRALWRSIDAGGTWKLVYPDPAAVTGVFENDDHATNRIASSASLPGAIEALAVDPGDSHVLYAAVYQGKVSHLFVSTDWGKAWKATADLPGGGHSVYVDPNSPRGDRTVYVIGDNSVAVRKRGTWQRGPAPPGVNSFVDSTLGFSGGKTVIYAISSTDAFASRDGGASWDHARLPGSQPELSGIAASGQHGEVAYLGFSRLASEGQSIFGVAKTTDAGRNWTLVWKETSAMVAANVHDIWLTSRFGPEWGGAPENLAVASNDPDFCIGTDSGRTLRTRDGGRNWEGVYSKRLKDGSYTSTGLDVTTNYGVHFDPFDPKRMFIAYTDIGLFRSENGGRGWVSATTTVPHSWVNTTYWMAFDPAVRGRMWAVMSYTHDLPRPKMWRDQDPSSYVGGVVMSEDGGRTWRVSNQGMPGTAATHILLDDSSPKDARVLYVAGFGRGVFKSSDGGKSWTIKNEGLSQKQPFAWRLAQASNRALYLVVARRSNDGSFGNDGDGALYRSIDAAGHWSRVSLPTGLNGPNGIAIDPHDSSRLYLAAWGRRGTDRATSGGIWISTDGGTSWRNTLSRDQFIYDVTIHPRNPTVLYACGFSSSAWRSEDRGETWQRIRGFNFKWGHRVIPDPLDPTKIYVTTYGGSVWHGPAKGDPHAVEDIVTPEVSYQSVVEMPFSRPQHPSPLSLTITPRARSRRPSRRVRRFQPRGTAPAQSTNSKASSRARESPPGASWASRCRTVCAPAARC
jgi:photosystem II stability/assembly factor-like uncharacterized protein